MENNDILQSLSKLEKNLEAIETARQQVINTVNAYEGARIQLTKLSGEFLGIHKELMNIVDIVKNNETLINSDLSSKVQLLITNFDKSLKKLVANASEIQTSFDNQCKSTCSTIVTNLETASTTITDNISSSIEVFKQQTNDIATKINASYELTLSKIENDLGESQTKLSSGIKGILDTTSSTISNEVKELANIITSLKQASETCQSNFSIHVTDVTSAEIKRFESVVNRCNEILDSSLKRMDAPITSLTNSANLLTGLKDSVQETIREEINRIEEKVDSIKTVINKLDSNEAKNKQEILSAIAACKKEVEKGKDTFVSSFSELPQSFESIKKQITLLADNQDKLFKVIDSVQKKNSKLNKFILIMLSVITVLIFVLFVKFISNDIIHFVRYIR